MEIINGFRCKDCTDAALASRHIDPAHPKDGPYGVFAKDNPDASSRAKDHSVVFGGILTSLSQARDGGASDPARANPTPDKTAGTQLDISA